MNIALEKTEEFVNGKLRRNYGDAFVRGNNGSRSSSPTLYLANLTGIHSALHFRELNGVGSIISRSPWKRLVLQERSASLHTPVTLILLLPVYCISILRPIFPARCHDHLCLTSEKSSSSGYPKPLHPPTTPIPGSRRG